MLTFDGIFFLVNQNQQIVIVVSIIMTKINLICSIPIIVYVSVGGKRLCTVHYVVLSRIRVKTLNEKSDVKALAKEIIDKCKLIHPSKILEVEQLLFYLQNRKDTTAVKGTVYDSHFY